MQVAQQQLAHPDLTAIPRPHQRAGVIESRRRVVRRQRMRPAKSADRRLAIVQQQPQPPKQLPAGEVVRSILQMAAQAKPQLLQLIHTQRRRGRVLNLLQQRRIMPLRLLPEQHLANITGFQIQAQAQDHQQQRARKQRPAA